MQETIYTGTATTVTSTRSPAIAGRFIGFWATVSATVPGGGTPTGTVAFFRMRSDHTRDWIGNATLEQWRGQGPDGPGTGRDPCHRGRLPRRAELRHVHRDRHPGHHRRYDTGQTSPRRDAGSRLGSRRFSYAARRGGLRPGRAGGDRRPAARATPSPTHGSPTRPAIPGRARSVGALLAAGATTFPGGGSSAPTGTSPSTSRRIRRRGCARKVSRSSAIACASARITSRAARSRDRRGRAFGRVTAVVSPSGPKSLPLILARELASNLSTAMFLLDAAGTLVYFNDSAEHPDRPGVRRARRDLGRGVR